MTEIHSPGARLLDALDQERPLQVVGTINAYAAIMAEQVGYRAIYLSGAGVANASFGLPDLGMTSLDNVLEEARRITAATRLPLLVDVDTGWGGGLNIVRTIQQMTRAGVAGVQIEDQIQSKRCGHRPGKSVVSIAEMLDRIKAAVDARTDPQFLIMARTDAVASQGVDPAIERAQRFVEAGADLVFPEALGTLNEYRQFVESVDVPVLANVTEFGKTPLFTVAELADVGVRLVLYPLSAFRAMNAAALHVYQAIRDEGTQKNVVDRMQTRQTLYDMLDYHRYEQQLDAMKGEPSE